MDYEKILQELTLEEKAGLCSGADFWHTKAVERMGVPEVMMCDGPHGLRKQLTSPFGSGDHIGLGDSVEAVCFPTASALASSFDTDVLTRLGEILGNECQAENIAMLLGPGLNMKRSPLCGRNFEYFSEDPYLAGKLGAAYIKGLQSKGVSACVKHFAANNQETRRMNGSSNLDERTLYEIYLPAFEAAVKEGGTRSVMCAYNAINGSYCAENKELLIEILRKKWGFDGFVVTDWGAVKDRVKGLLSGLDLEMPGGQPHGSRQIMQAVMEGKLDEAVLDEAVRNILKFVADYQSSRKPDTVYDLKKDHDLSAEIETECAVLMKNNGVLPLKKNAKVVFMGEFAKKPRYQGGGSSHINSKFVTGALEAAENATFVDDIKKDFEIIKNADAVVMFAGLPDAYETEGLDRKTLAMPEEQNRQISEIAAVQPNTIVVLHGGSPVVMPWLSDVSAVLCMYLGGDGVGKAAVDLLYGDVNPSGKLAETWPMRLEDNPSHLTFPGEDGISEYREGIYIGYRYYDKRKMDVQLPFGFGLSYTQFEYSELAFDKTELYDTDTLTVTCKVKNTGTVMGKEAAQLYVRDVESAVGRPVRELKGFTKLSLMPGEEKTVSFTLDKRSFAYYEPKIHDWFVESGVFMVEIGASSRDIRLFGNVQVNGTAEIPIVFSRDTSVGVVMSHPKGQALASAMSQNPFLSMNGDDKKVMPDDGSDGMFQAMMTEIPLSGLINFGIVTPEQLDAMIDMLNS